MNKPNSKWIGEKWQKTVNHALLSKSQQTQGAAPHRLVWRKLTPRQAEPVQGSIYSQTINLLSRKKKKKKERK